jgi:ribosomal-protein-alanine N-acetyltransferase
MRVDDLEQVHAIDRVSFSMPWPESSYRYELLENSHARLWVAEAADEKDEKQVVGAVVVWLIEDEAHIATLCVHPDYRGRGISREILAVALMESIQQGAHLATLEVRANNLIAQALYRRFRFEILGRRPRYYRDNNEDALIMTVDGLDDGYARWLASGGWKK